MEKQYKLFDGKINGIPLCGDGKFHDARGPKTFLKQYFPDNKFYEITKEQVFGYPSINKDWVRVTDNTGKDYCYMLG